MAAYYNENDGFAAEWLRNLIRAGHIAPGDVDERSIVDVRGDDLVGYDQCHFFAGIGVWGYALRRSGWLDDRPVWTGSCPCQPFSAAGKRQGTGDERHLWPVWFQLIRERRPAIVFGEQVAGSAGYGWWDAVSADLEGEGYACGAADLAAAGVGAPHIRQRLYWVAIGDGQLQHRRGDIGARRRSEDSDRGELGGMAEPMRAGWSEGRPEPGRRPASGGCGFNGLADSGGPRLEVERQQPARDQRATAERGGEAGRLANANGRNPGEERQQRGGEQRQQPQDGRSSWLDVAEGERHGANDLEPVAGRGQCSARQANGAHVDGATPASPLNGHWRDADWLFCTDERWRPVEPASFPLAHGVAGRVGRLRAYGNAICAPLAVEFIRAAGEALHEVSAHG